MRKIKRIISLYMCMVIVSGLVLTGCKEAGAKTETGSTSDDTFVAVPIGPSEEGKTFMDSLSKVDETTDEDAYTKRMNALVEVLTPAWENTGKYHSVIDLAEIYPDEQAFNADCDEFLAWSGKIKEYKGKLTDAQTIYEFEQLLNDEDMNNKIRKMNMYVDIGQSRDITDEHFEKLYDKWNELVEQYAEDASFINEELMSIPFEQRVEIFDDPVFDGMEYYFSYYTSPDSEVISGEAMEKITKLEVVVSDAEQEYEDYRYADFEFPQVVINGEPKDLTDSYYASLMQYPNVTREQKIMLFEHYVDGFFLKSDDFVNILKKNFDAEWEMATLSNCESVRQMAMEDAGVDEEIYGLVIASARESSEDFRRYLELHKKGLGFDKQYGFDLGTLVSTYEPDPISFDDAVDLVREAARPLGDDWIEAYNSLVSGNNIDVGRGDNRAGSTYTMNAGKGNQPHIFISYYGGGYPGVSTLAHETGHAVNEIFFNEAQPEWYRSSSVFDAEVCSTVNELLINAYMLEKASDNEERLYYLEELIDNYNNAVFDQCMYSELEDYLYEKTEDGQTITSECIDTKMSELTSAYYGDTVTDYRPVWMNMEHLLYCYYMYQYATSMYYASAIASDIINGDETAINNYKEFMKMGSSSDSMSVLNVAGIDPLDEATYEKANKYYKSLVDQYEELIKAR